MKRSQNRIGWAVLVSAVIVAGCMIAQAGKPMMETPKPTALDGGPAQTYFPVVPAKPFDEVKAHDEKMQPKMQSRQKQLLERRYDLSDNPSKVWMSGHRKKVQQGVRVKLPDGMTWQKLAEMDPAEIKERGLFPRGFLPLPHAHHRTGGQVFPDTQIDEMERLEKRDLSRFDIKFDLPEHLTPEFPPPIFLTTHPELGDVSQGKVLSIKNYYDIMHGLLTPV